MTTHETSPAPAPATSLEAPKQPVILWRNAWNINNIGDIGHTPGGLALLRKYIPEAKVIVWAQRDLVLRDDIAQKARFVDGAVDAGDVSRKVIPDIEFVLGLLDADGKADNPALEAAVAQADIMVIGSGAGILASEALMRFHRRTGKPIGMFGITTDPFNFLYLEGDEASTDTQALRAASFVFTREKTSLRALAGEDVNSPNNVSVKNPATPVNETIHRTPITLDFSKIKSAFVPDTTFAFNVRDDAAAAQFMQSHGLEPQKFVCFVPRHRWTPGPNPTRQGESRDLYNSVYVNEDHDKLKVAIIDYVRQTGNKVAIVPETIYVVADMGAWLKDGLPDDVAQNVVVRENYWLPDEAASVFAHAQAVVSIENHSPIIAAAMGTPFVMVHQPEDSYKSDMFANIGLADWYVANINRATGADVSAALMGIVNDMPAARAKLKEAMTLVHERFAFGMQAVREALRLNA